MAKMTGGEAHYVRRVNLGEYQHKECSARVTWSADEADSHEHCVAMSHKAAAHAVHVVHSQLGIAAPKTVTAEVAGMAALEKVRQITGAAEHAPITAPAPTVELPTADGGHLTVPATLASDAVLKSLAVEPEPAPLPKRTKKAPVTIPATPAVEPPVSDEDLLGPTPAATVAPSTKTAAPATDIGDPLLDELEDSAPVQAPTEITIEDVTKAVSAKFGGGANRHIFPAFKLGLPKFAPQISAIAADRRGEFLDWLNAL